jgi:hypothetical protein
MSKSLTLFCALAVGLVLVVPAFAEVQNVKVGGDITVRGVYREDYDLTSTSKTDATVSNEDEGAWFMSTVRLRVDADLTDNVSATVRLLNERDWDTETATSNDIDLDLASITLKEMFYSPLTVTIGRQDIVIGDGLILADPYPNHGVGNVTNIDARDLSARNSFDAVRASLDYDPLTIDLIYAKITEQDEPITGNVLDDEDTDFFMANADYNLGGAWNTVLSGYYAYERDQNWATQLDYTKDGEGTITFDDKLTHVIGGRITVEPTVGLVLKGEAAYQFGEIQDNSPGDTGDTGASGASVEKDIKAWALDLAGSYALDTTWSPVVGLKYAFRSGEGNKASGDYEAWDVLYEGQTNGIVANALSLGGYNNNNTNMHIIGAGLSVTPLTDLTLGVDYFRYILDEELDTGSDSATYTTDDDWGDEVDVTLSYAYTEDVTLGLQYGRFFVGDAFESANDDDATQVLGTVAVKF